jgi:hypothetical protein
VEAAAQKAYKEFAFEAVKYLQANPTASFSDIGVAAAGFSRGSPTAVRFAQILNEKGLQGPTGQQWAPPGSIAVDALALIDPVNTFVNQSSGISGNVRNVLVLSAADENRTDFRVLDYSFDSRVTNLWLRGNHSGLGGGYDLNGTGANALEGLTGYFQNSGYGLAPVPVSQKFDLNTSANLYTEAYQTAANGDVLSNEDGTPKLVWRIDTGSTRQTVLGDKVETLAPSVYQLWSDPQTTGTWTSQSLNFGSVNYNLFDAAQNNDASYKMWSLNQNNGLSTNAYNSFTQQSSNFVVDYSLGGTGNSNWGQFSPPSNFDFFPIGAFYDSQSAAFDNAASIANKTTRAMNASGQALSAQQMAALDANNDGQISTAEASGARLWADLNENGTLDSNELQSVGSAIQSADYGFYTQGNGSRGPSAFNGTANVVHWRQVA